MNEQINAFTLLKEEMENDEISIRVNAIHRLKIVATLTSPEDVKNLVLPYLEGLIKKEDDEVLFAVAEEFGNLASFLPGNQSLVLPSLEILSAVEETVVRDQAVRSLNVVSKLLSDNEILNKYIPMVLKLANNDTNFTCRVSAIHLMCHIYHRAGSVKEKIRQKFSELSAEETPMVKRAIASKIGDFCKSIEKEFLMSELITIFKQLANDEQDAVRVICLDNLKSIIECLNKEENKTHIIQIIIAATEDKAWRVRLSLAKNFPQLVEVYGKDITESSLIPNFQTLLKDDENEVKIAAINSLSQFIKSLSVEKIANLIPPIQALAKDQNDQVRAHTIDVIAEIVKINKDICYQKLMDSLTELFSDENPSVRSSVIKAAINFILEIGGEILPILGPSLKNASEDNKWRVRLETLEGVVKIAQHFKQVDMFSKYLEPLFLHYLKDRASAVREVGVAKLKTLVEIFKTDWALQTIIPKLNDVLKQETGYLFKIAALNSYQSIMEAAPHDKEIPDKLIPALVKYCKDALPNIKIVICRIFKKVIQTVSVSASTTTLIKNCANELKNDKDKDVLFYSQDIFNS